MSEISKLINPASTGAAPVEGRAPLEVNFNIDGRYDILVEDGTVNDLVIENKVSGYIIVEV